MNRKFLISGIGTDIGKTIVSAILIKKYGFTYWKPIQSGNLEASDTSTIQKLLNHKVKTIPEKYGLIEPLSPDYSAFLMGLDLSFSIEDFPQLKADENILIEGAGGLLVPINKEMLIIDLAKLFDLEVILVSKNYLGSINHTLLSLSYIKQYDINFAGLIFVGDSVPFTENSIINFGQKILKNKFKVLGRVNNLTDFTENTLNQAGEGINLF